jgi:hypothetical protein
MRYYVVSEFFGVSIAKLRHPPESPEIFHSTVKSKILIFSMVRKKVRLRAGESIKFSGLSLKSEFDSGTRNRSANLHKPTIAV